jgi:hypothetical protein
MQTSQKLRRRPEVIFEYMKTPKLPKTPSKLVAIARRDLMAVRRMKKYRVDMGIWHTPMTTNHHGDAFDYADKATPKTPCFVCQAGAVIARTLKANINADAGPYAYDGLTRRQLVALNRLRQGSVRSFIYSLREVPAVERWIGKNFFKTDMGFIPGYSSYHTNPKKYLAWLKAVEKWLKSEGL